MCASRKLFVGSNKNSVSWCVTFTVIPRRDMLEKVRNCVSSNFCSKNRDISGSLKYLKIINKIILIRKFYFKIGKNFNKDRTLSLLIFLSSRSKKHIISDCVSPNSSIWKRKRKRHQSRNRGAIRVTPHCVRVHSACIGVYTTAYKQAAYF